MSLNSIDYSQAILSILKNEKFTLNSVTYSIVTEIYVLITSLFETSQNQVNSNNKLIDELFLMMVDISYSNEQLIQNKFQLLKVLLRCFQTFNEVKHKIIEIMNENSNKYSQDSNITLLANECRMTINSEHSTIKSVSFSKEYIISTLLDINILIKIKLENHQFIEMYCNYETTGESFLQSICDYLLIPNKYIRMFVLYIFDDDNQLLIIDSDVKILSIISANSIILKEKTTHFYNTKKQYSNYQIIYENNRNIKISNNTYQIICNKLFHLYIWYYPNVTNQLINSFDRFTNLKSDESENIYDFAVKNVNDNVNTNENINENVNENVNVNENENVNENVNVDEDINEDNTDNIDKSLWNDSTEMFINYPIKFKNEIILYLLFYQFYNNFLLQSILTLSSDVIILLAGLVCKVLYPEITHSKDIFKYLYKLFPKSFVDLRKHTEIIVKKVYFHTNELLHVSVDMNNTYVLLNSLMNHQQWKEYLCNEVFQAFNIFKTQKMALNNINAITLYLSLHRKELHDDSISFSLFEFRCINLNKSSVVIVTPNEINE